MRKPSLGGKLRLGFWVFGVLLALEITEYLVGTNLKKGNWPYLAILAVVAAAPIIYYFMHIAQLWRREE